MNADQDATYRMLHEAAVRSQTDVQVHAEIETTRQIVAQITESKWIHDDDIQALICLAASIAITLHDPMDGRPYMTGPR